MKKKNHRGAIALLATAGAVATLIACGGGGGGTAAGIPAGSTIAAPGTDPATGAPGASPQLGACEMFPPQAVFNTRIDDTSRFPAHPSSDAWIASVGPSTPFRADWWRYEDPTQRDSYFGMPVNVVDGTAATTDWAQVQYDFSPSGVSSQVGWPHESDCAVADGAGGYTLKRGCSTVPAAQRRFPFPRTNVKNEGGACHDPNTCGDHHVLVVEQGACRLWEGYATYPIGGQWYTMSSAAWDLKSLAMRPSSWTAGDAAGLPITPFLAKAAEAASGEIRHALRVTFRDAVIARSFVWPARHFAGGDTPGGIPFGALLRLKASFVIPDSWSPHAKAIALAAKRYGLYVADIGQDFYVQGEPNTAWGSSLFGELRNIPLSQMEFVDLGSITRDPRFSADSMAASW
ncbi:hypothetical protein EZ313_11105 [Ramlibacter henchirensis]|uniref:Uncharacterized protein n=1 Tax=Ramlibacter henchirensis TaxID=204072 RepID=A0A4Z0C776_9BURK|nr:hypothetical protein [Ramlibacter henchirensis]TFZ07131.1 hypothetical protein EZ313_11105 [Ramlibacter henchirensis]